MEKILIGIPSYNEYDLIHTISCLVNNAKYPERLTVSLFLQYDDGLFEEYFGVDIKNIRSILPKTDIVNYIIMSASTKDPIGVCVARYNIFDQITDEEYFLSVDAHMCAKKNWDTILISDLKELVTTKKNNKIIISSNNNLWEKGDENFNLVSKDSFCGVNNIRKITHVNPYGRFETFNGTFTSFMRNNIIEYSHLDIKYDLVNFFVGLFAFGPSSWIKEVGWSTNYKFYGEEPDISMRSFCYGWDIYSTVYDTIIAAIPTMIGKAKPDSTVSNRNYNSQEIVKLFMTGKNKFIDLTHTERTYIDFLKFHNFFNEVVGDNIDMIDPNTLINKHVFI